MGKSRRDAGKYSFRQGSYHDYQPISVLQDNISKGIKFTRQKLYFLSSASLISGKIGQDRQWIAQWVEKKDIKRKIEKLERNGQTGDRGEEGEGDSSEQGTDRMRLMGDK